MTSPQPHLKLPLKTGIAKIVNFDFERFRYMSVPSKANFSNSVIASREYDVERWFQYFKNENEYADTTKWGYIHDFIKFVRLCDELRLNPETEQAVIAWERHLVESVRLGSMHINSARKLISSIKAILSKLHDDATSWFSQYSLFRSEIHPTQGYSDKELAKLIRIIHLFFKQVSSKIISNPTQFNASGCSENKVLFTYGGAEHKVNNALTKCFSAAYFLLAYYTFANSTCILKMVKTRAGNQGNNIWFEQSVFKARANKYVSISIGDNGTFTVPKYALSFFEQLLKLSSVTSDSESLLFSITNQTVAALEFNHVQSFSTWIQKKFNLLDDYHKPLKALSTKFRASGSYRYLALTGNEIETASLLGNTPTVMKRHYSTGNESENYKQLHATATTLENAIKCGDINEAKRQTKDILEVEVLPYEEFINKYSFTEPQKTVLGTGCKSPFGQEAEKYQRKMNFSPQILNVENLACSDVVNCFFCKNQVIIESVEDIWCLLSFRECILDSKEEHTNKTQFVRNFEELLERINLTLFSLTPSVKRKAQKKLLFDGRHPLWPENFNIDF
jgi:hypothetical protein